MEREFSLGGRSRVKILLLLVDVMQSALHEYSNGDFNFG